MSDFTIEWKLGVNAYELRESLKLKVEEDDIITYYILKDGKYFDEFTVDYMKDDSFLFDGERGNWNGIAILKPNWSKHRIDENGYFIEPPIYNSLKTTL